MRICAFDGCYAVLNETGEPSTGCANASRLSPDLFFAVDERVGVHHQTVQRCIERALAYGPLMALDDRPRPGAGRMAASDKATQADALLRYLASPEVAPVFREAGLEP